MFYIQHRYNGFLETIDQAETKKEANYLLGEYQLCMRSAEIYISKRCCKDWRNRS